MKSAPGALVSDPQVQKTHRQLTDHVLNGGKLAIVKAPPGSGKTYLLLQVAVAALRKRMRVAVATQTNTQADDICERLAAERTACTRFASSSRPRVDLGRTVGWETKASRLPAGPCIVVGPSAKWGLVSDVLPFDVLLVEEAWQLAWGDFILLRQVSDRFVLIGDPGQIPPVVSIDVSRWVTAPRPPHAAAPQVLVDEKRDCLFLELPKTMRLPADTVDLIRSFYDFPFDAYARPGERAVEVSGPSKSAADKAIDLLRSGSAVGYTLPTPPGGPPLDCDRDMARVAVSLADRLLDREAMVLMDGRRRRLEASDIGLCATHRIMNGAIEMVLTSRLKERVTVETPERWQGLQRKVLIMVHPLSGVVRPSSFDLETGRLCVMASRHQAGLIVLTRDHLPETLDEYLPPAEQGVGEPDVAGRGHDRNQRFWRALQDADRVVAG